MAWHLLRWCSANRETAPDTGEGRVTLHQPPTLIRITELEDQVRQERRTPLYGATAWWIDSQCAHSGWHPEKREGLQAASPYSEFRRLTVGPADRDLRSPIPPERPRQAIESHR